MFFAGERASGQSREVARQVRDHVHFSKIMRVTVRR